MSPSATNAPGGWAASREGGGAGLVVIEPATGVVWPDLGELWEHRTVLLTLVWRNVNHRYRQTLLGPLWFIVSPLVRMFLFSLVLGRIAGLPSEGVPYGVFTYVALLPWEVFASGVARGTSSFVTHHPIITKVWFPRLLLPAAEVLTSFVDFCLSFGILVAMLLYHGFWPNPRWLLLLPLLLLTLALSLGIGLLFAGLQARYRDTTSFLGYVLRFWFYATPVAYSATIVLDRIPQSAGLLYRLNPMYAVIEGFRWALLGTGRPPGASFLLSAIGILGLLVVGSLVFLRREHSIVDLG